MIQCEIESCLRLHTLEAARPDVEAAERAFEERRRRDTQRAMKLVKKLLDLLVSLSLS